MKSKIIALLIAAAMLTLCLAGCGSTENASSAASSEPASSAVSSEPASSADEPDETELMFAAAYAKYDPDAVVLTVNGTEVTWSEYYPWLYSMTQQIIATYGAEVDWTEVLSGEYTYQGYAQYYAESMASQYVVIDDAANELGLTLTDEEKAQLESIKQSDADNYTDGDLEAFGDYLAKIYMTEDYYDYINAVSLYYYDAFEHYFGADGSEVSDEDAINYATDTGYMHAKHILFMTQDSDGNALDEATVAEKLAAAQDTLAKLNACTDPAEQQALFDTLMGELTEDSGYFYYPDGYYFVSGDMVEEFETAVEGLEDYQISDIVESAYGYHIIMRLPILPDDVVDYDSSGNPCTLRYMTASSLYQAIADEWFNTIDLQYTDEFANLDFSTLFVL